MTYRQLMAAINEAAKREMRAKFARLAATVETDAETWTYLDAEKRAAEMALDEEIAQ